MRVFEQSIPDKCNRQRNRKKTCWQIHVRILRHKLCIALPTIKMGHKRGTLVQATMTSFGFYVRFVPTYRTSRMAKWAFIARKACKRRLFLSVKHSPQRTP